MLLLAERIFSEALLQAIVQINTKEKHRKQSVQSIIVHPTIGKQDIYQLQSHRNLEGSSEDSNIRQHSFRLYLQSWANSEQANKAVHSNPHAPCINRLEFAAFIYQSQKSILSYMTAAPQHNSLQKRCTSITSILKNLTVEKAKEELRNLPSTVGSYQQQQTRICLL